MASNGSVTRWIGALRAGDHAAAQQLWERYFRRLVGLARKKLEHAPRRAADEEDVALSAFDSFCRNAERGRFPRLADRDSLWRLLVVLTARKAAHLVRDQDRLKRRGAAAAADSEDEWLDEVLSREPDPAFAAQVAEEYQRLLALLGDAGLREVAVGLMEGYKAEEIGARLGYARRSITRKLKIIRELWMYEVPP